AHDPFVSAAEGDETRLVPADDVWQHSDVITLHAPATSDIHHIVNDATLHQMRPGAYLVNCARGSLVDHVALLAALDAGRRAAVLRRHRAGARAPRPSAARPSTGDRDAAHGVEHGRGSATALHVGDRQRSGGVARAAGDRRARANQPAMTLTRVGGYG